MRTVCLGLCVLKFKYSAAPTRRTTVTTVGTCRTNHCPPSQLVLFPQPFHFLSYVLMYLIITAWRHWLKTFSISSILILQSVCLHPAYPVFTLSILSACLSFHHDDYAITLFCLYLSIYSAASISSFRNFLTLKFLSEEFIKIAYSHPLSSQCHALSFRKFALGGFYY